MWILYNYIYLQIILNQEGGTQFFQVYDNINFMGYKDI